MIGTLQTHILENEIAYTGKELRAHFGLEKTKKYGSLIVGFIGPCSVPTENLVDWEDKLAHDFIEAKQMLHFIGEFFGITLETGVHMQRLLMVHAESLLRKKGFSQIERKGDDLFVEGKKLSVSIATVSNVSVLVHWGLNVDSTGAPVNAIGLNALNWSKKEVLDFAKELLTQYSSEIDDIQTALVKVKPVL